MKIPTIRPLLHLARRAALVGLASLLAASAHAQTRVVVGYQLIPGPFVTAIANGTFDAALKNAGYQADWRQFTSGGDISTALASGNVPVGIIGSPGITAAATRGVDLQLFWILDGTGQAEALVARNGSDIASTADLRGKRVATPFVSTAHFHLLVGMEQIWKIPPREVRILNMQPPQIVAAWHRGDIDAAYVWPPALLEISKTGKIIADSEEIGRIGVPTFDGIVADRAWAAKHPKFMAAFTNVLTQTYTDFRTNRTQWTADSKQVHDMIRLIGGEPDDIVTALNLLEFPTVQEQLSRTWLGGGKDAGAARAFAASANFLRDQKQIEQVLPDYSIHVTDAYAKAVGK